MQSKRENGRPRGGNHRARYASSAAGLRLDSSFPTTLLSETTLGIRQLGS